MGEEAVMAYLSLYFPRKTDKEYEKSWSVYQFSG